MIIKIRKALTNDIYAVAALHTLSWRVAYKNIMSAGFLAKEVEKDRLQTWQQRFRNSDNYCVWVAEMDKTIVGFVCLIPNHDQEMGSLLDNIHVTPEMKGKGVGKMLFQHALKFSKELSTNAPVYLWVFEQNTEAIRFYEKLGGKLVETTKNKVPDGTIATVSRYVWN
jgi:GNAT superfamily N-acetyltransferase